MMLRGENFEMIFYENKCVSKIKLNAKKRNGTMETLIRINISLEIIKVNRNEKRLTQMLFI